MAKMNDIKCDNCQFNENCFLEHDLKKCKKIREEKKIFLNWYGGKANLLEHILPFPEHFTYLELFGGGGSVLLNKVPAKMEIYNDIYTDLVTCFKYLRDNLLMFYMLQLYLPHAKAVFKLLETPLSPQGKDFIFPTMFSFLMDNNLDLIVDKEGLMRATAFFYRNRLSFLGMNAYFRQIMINRASTRMSRSNKAIENFDFFFKTWNRIQNVFFYNEDYTYFLVKRKRVIDKKGVLIYLDPPYSKGGKKYKKFYTVDNKENPQGRTWDDDAFAELFNTVKEYDNARVVISFDDPSYLDGDKWHVQKIERANALQYYNKGSMEIKTEYIIRNFDNDKVKHMYIPKNGRNMALDLIIKENENK
ncbi:MAG: DNA adenine methylase [Promethearchaeota archaeon]